MSSFDDTPPPPRSRRMPRPPRGLVGTAIKLLLACLAVGAVLTALGVNPVDFWRGLFAAIVKGAHDLYAFGLDGFGIFLAVIASGAIIVLPLWGLKRLLGLLRR